MVLVLDLFLDMFFDLVLVLVLILVLLASSTCTSLSLLLHLLLLLLLLLQVGFYLLLLLPKGPGYSSVSTEDFLLAMEVAATHQTKTSFNGRRNNPPGYRV